VNEARRRAYLEALGLPVWVLRDGGAGEAPATAAGARLRICPGSGGTLLVCGSAAETASTLAADIVRAIGGDPAWAWPEREEGVGDSLAEAVSERLLTAIVVFGVTLADEVFGGDAPAAVGSARVVVAPRMAALGAEPGARRTLWRQLVEAGAARTA